MEPSPPGNQAKPDDGLTISAIATLAMCLATFAHEVLGHGMACVLAGGRIERMTSVYFSCAPGSRLAAIGGPCGNLVAALVAGLALHWLPTSALRARLLALSVAAVSLFWVGGQLVDSMIEGAGDYAIGLGQPAAAWRLGGTLLGVLWYFLSVRFVARRAAAFGGEHGRARRLMRMVWAVALSTAVLAALFYAPKRLDAAWQAALEIGANSFGLLLIGRRARSQITAPGIPRSVAWIAAALIVYALFIATLGRGLAAGT